MVAETVAAAEAVAEKAATEQTATEKAAAGQVVVLQSTTNGAQACGTAASEGAAAEGIKEAVHLRENLAALWLAFPHLDVLSLARMAEVSRAFNAASRGRGLWYRHLLEFFDCELYDRLHHHHATQPAHHARVLAPFRFARPSSRPSLPPIRNAERWGNLGEDAVPRATPRFQGMVPFLPVTVAFRPLACRANNLSPAPPR